MARSRVVVATSAVLAAVLALLAVVGWFGFARLRHSQERLTRAAEQVTAYSRLQRAIAEEVEAEAAYRRLPGETMAIRLTDTFAPAVSAIRGVDAEVAELAYLLVLQDRYSGALRHEIDGRPSDAADVALVDEMQRLVGVASEQAQRDLGVAAEHQRSVVGQMTWRAPLVLLLAFLIVGLCWRLLAAYGARAMVRAHHNEQLAMRDPLTGLANRRSFEQGLSTELTRPDPDCAVLLLDLDGFKAINDTWGHDVGDKVLVTVAERLRTTVRNTDVVARIGGDEFAVLARPAHQAGVLRERLAECLSRPMPVAGVLLHPSASIGLAPVLAGATQSDVLREADHGLYEVKRARPTSGRRLGARQASQ
jgi:diguanylate cyclase (GGDEF)-like protein